jgi:hypothetical protein
MKGHLSIGCEFRATANQKPIGCCLYATNRAGVRHLAKKTSPGKIRSQYVIAPWVALPLLLPV